MTKLLTMLALSFGAWSMPPTAVAAVSVSISVRIAPPLLPVYIQPAPPAANFLWMPGYWAWDDEGYYWVPGTWVMAPRRGYLWTPGYWSWGSGFYYWHQGYWGPHVGYYGGVAYGYGYYGSGYDGGRWEGDHFHYNRAVNNVNVTHITNTYNETVVHNTTTINRVSYNGGQGGIAAQPNEREVKAGREPHQAFTDEQTRHQQGARGNRALRASENGGAPPIAATPRPSAFNHRDARPATKEGAPRQKDSKARAPVAEPPAARKGGRENTRTRPAPAAQAPREPQQQRETGQKQRGTEQQQRETGQQPQQRQREAEERQTRDDEPGQQGQPGAKEKRKKKARKGDAEDDAPQ
jgi:hypothetical protein